MTREKAVQITNLLYNIEGIESFKDEFELWSNEYEDIPDELIDDIFQLIDKYLKKYVELLNME